MGNQRLDLVGLDDLRRKFFRHFHGLHFQYAFIDPKIRIVQII